MSRPEPVRGQHVVKEALPPSKPPAPAPPPPRQFIPYEIPLAPGERARLVLPADLTAAEAERLCGVIRSVAFPDGAAGAEHEG